MHGVGFGLAQQASSHIPVRGVGVVLSGNRPSVGLSFLWTVVGDMMVGGMKLVAVLLFVGAVVPGIYSWTLERDGKHVFQVE